MKSLAFTLRRLTTCLLLLLAAGSQVALAQAGDAQDTDSTDIMGQFVADQELQAKLDSMVRASLLHELDSVAANAQRRAELETRLAALQAADSARQAARRSLLESLKRTSVGAAVAPFGDTLHIFHVRLGSLTPQQRADGLADQLKRLSRSLDFAADSLRVINYDGNYDIVYAPDRILTTVTALDALWEGKTQEVLAAELKQGFAAAIEADSDENRLANWGRRILLILLILGAVIGVTWVVRKVFAKLERYLVAHKGHFFGGIKVRGVKFFGPKELARLAVMALRWTRTVVVVTAIYLSLPLLFSLFPDTKTYAHTLIEWVLAPARNALHGFVDYLPSLFTIIVTWFITRFLVRVVAYFSREVENGRIHLPGFHCDWAKPTFNIAKFLMYAFMLVIIFPYLPGADSPAFQGISVFLGVLISLGSSSAITNMIAGLVITYMRPFKQGDRVKIGEVTGDVIEKTMLVTRIRTIKNEDITVPNSAVLNSHTINYSANAHTMGLILNTKVTISYDVPWRKMHAALINAALRTPGVEAQPAPFVFQTSLDDFYVSYQINAFTRDPNHQDDIYSALHQHIQDSCFEAGIEIMSPHFRSLRDGNTVSMPSDYWPEGYVPPSFRVEMQDRPAEGKNGE